jgi:hypothetical protein
VIVRLDHHITPLERITFQAVLGSDPRREALALIDYMTPSIHPLTCFFEKPGTVIPGYEKETL